MLLGTLIFFFYKKEIQGAPIGRSLERKAQIQTGGAGRWSTTAELAGLGPSVPLLLQSAAGINLLAVVSSPALLVKYRSIIKACESQRD